MIINIQGSWSQISVLAPLTFSLSINPNLCLGWKVRGLAVVRQKMCGSLFKSFRLWQRDRCLHANNPGELFTSRAKKAESTHDNKHAAVVCFHRAAVDPNLKEPISYTSLVIDLIYFVIINFYMTTSKLSLRLFLSLCLLDMYMQISCLVQKAVWDIKLLTASAWVGGAKLLFLLCHQKILEFKMGFWLQFNFHMWTLE